MTDLVKVDLVYILLEKIRDFHHVVDNSVVILPYSNHQIK